jgi:hypothetical protein
MIKIAGVVLVAALLVPAEVQLAAFPPGTRITITTRAMGELTLPSVSARFHQDEAGWGWKAKGVEVTGGSSIAQGRRLCVIRPNDGSRLVLFPIGEARVQGELIAVESGLVTLKLDDPAGEAVLPLDGVAGVTRASRLPKSARIGLAIAGVLASGFLATKVFNKQDRRSRRGY